MKSYSPNIFIGLRIIKNGARYRLRKKLELNKKENLIGFLMVT